ncbi:glycosyltransferase 87 family protein [Okibacterium fritillariae]|uniref:DUF2029 domain-containing protein n=1 Tax=Okibacterium fritillariae TaxID=123320 RepID=A0A1T5KI85_9MICO|nr:glycosyltransferase 87 family protein [Okibacterium fritillariae]SKC63403.1 Protein of unknown function [Okibacterium fritillariae]
MSSDPSSSSAAAPRSVPRSAPGSAPVPASVPSDGLLWSAPVLWVAFLVVHVIVSLGVIYAPNTPLNDVTGVYLGWMREALAGGPVVGIDAVWVYPIAALVPMAIPLLGGTSVVGYGFAWLVLVAALDAVAFWFLLGSAQRGTRTRARCLAAWWCLAFLLLFGVIGVARLDALTASLSLIAMLIAVNRPIVASVLLAVATWIKIWPAAILAAAFIVLRSRWRVAAAAAGTSVVIVAAALVAGSGLTVFSFITEQTGRGIQIESPVAVPYLWATSFGAPGFTTYFDREILTFQLTGTGAGVVSTLMTPLLVIALAVVAWFGWRATRAGASAVRLFPQVALALVLVFIVFNKVGSPQYLSWLVAPVAALIVVGGRRVPLLAGLTLVVAAMTQIIYPYYYDALVQTQTWMVLLITLRNAGLAVMLVIVAVEIWRAGSEARAAVPLASA